MYHRYQCAGLAFKMNALTAECLLKIHPELAHLRGADSGLELWSKYEECSFNVLTRWVL